ncbi:MAG: TRAP transporter large permease [Defluviicoccus sp.]|nr:TRAP transporter large permease [Defluviicoccus sp.]
MSGVEIGLISIAAILVLIYLGMHVAVTLCVVSLIGVWAVKGNVTLATKLLAIAAYDTVAGYVFGVVPLFVLMGLLVSVSDLGKDAYVVANILMRRIRGGLGIATVAANAVFAAVTGISVASAAVFTKLAVPEMISLGYRPRFAVGVVAGSSVLGMLIPPSLLLIVYALLAEQSIGDLFIAGIVPGILLSFAFAIAILGMATFLPRTVMREEAGGAASGEPVESLAAAILRLWPLPVLVFAVIGGIYLGWFTPTESGAVGALGALVLAFARRKLTWANVWQVLVETGHVTVSILMLIIAANIYTRLLALSGVPVFINDFVNGLELGFFTLLIFYAVIIVIMGTILDGISIMLIMIPIFLPLLAGYSVDLVWFGIVTVIAVEIGLLTPPLGLSAYVIKSTLDTDEISLADIFIGAAPFAVVMFVVLLLIIFFPWLVTGYG